MNKLNLLRKLVKMYVSNHIDPTYKNLVIQHEAVMEDYCNKVICTNREKNMAARVASQMINNFYNTNFLIFS